MRTVDGAHEGLDRAISATNSVLTGALVESNYVPIEPRMPEDFPSRALTK